MKSKWQNCIKACAHNEGFYQIYIFSKTQETLIVHYNNFTFPDWIEMRNIIKSDYIFCMLSDC